MKKLLKALPIFAFVLITSCQDSAVEEAEKSPEDFQDSPEAAATKMAGIQNRLADVMESIKDKESGEAALAKLEPIVAEMKAFGKAMKGKDEDLSPELEAKLEGIISQSQTRIEAAVMKAAPILSSEPELAQKFQTLMTRMTE
ncbi:hypothetical protein V2O64_04695 [Verrucomicrobiaceae bacterium 227]